MRRYDSGNLYRNVQLDLWSNDLAASMANQSGIRVLVPEGRKRMIRVGVELPRSVNAHSSGRCRFAQEKFVDSPTVPSASP
ncbi:MAG: hypothetical protein OXH03_04795 [Bacteroidetes bacterium]|nr:hypothetical protein [Bacteroidota bacterium]MDE2672297.1 hypothetical protein [Bacteroidota bacterium]